MPILLLDVEDQRVVLPPTNGGDLEVQRRRRRRERVQRARGRCPCRRSTSRADGLAAGDRASSDALHWSRPLLESLSVLRERDRRSSQPWSCSAALFLTNELELHGLRLLLRAGLGRRDRSRRRRSSRGVWAMATDARRCERERGDAGDQETYARESPPQEMMSVQDMEAPVDRSAMPRTQTTPLNRPKGFAASVARAVRAPPDAIPAPAVPARAARGSTSRRCAWTSSAGRPVLVEFWDFCRVNSLRTLPYLKAWHERYADDGPARDRRPHRRLPARARRRTAVARGGRAARDRVPGGDRRASSRSGTSTATRAGPARYLWDAERRAVLDALRRGRLRGDRARDPGAARRRARAVAPRAPRGRAGRAARRRRPPTSPAPTPARTRRAACGRCSRAPASVRVNGARARGRPSRAATRSSSTRATPRASSSSRSARA